MFQIDKLACKREVVIMIIRGCTLAEIVEAIARHGEKCSKSSVYRYIAHKLIGGHINADGSIEAKERERHQIRTIKYPSDANADDAVDIEFLNNY